MKHAKDYNGHKIFLTDDYHFRAEGPAIDKDDEHNYSSLRQAEGAIDEAVQLEKVQKVRERTTKVLVLDEGGEAVLITGINRSTRQLTGLKRDRNNYVYPTTPWIRQALIELEKLEANVRSRQAQLRPFGIDAKRGYGRLTASEYDDVVSRFEKEVEKNTKLAEKGPPELKPVKKGDRWY